MSNKRIKKQVEFYKEMEPHLKDDHIRSHVDQLLKPEEQPPFDVSPVGRHRIVKALRRRYGETYRSIPGVEKALKTFDGELNFRKLLGRVKKNGG